MSGGPREETGGHVSPSPPACTAHQHVEEACVCVCECVLSPRDSSNGVEMPGCLQPPGKRLLGDGRMTFQDTPPPPLLRWSRARLHQVTDM